MARKTNPDYDSSCHWSDFHLFPISVITRLFPLPLLALILSSCENKSTSNDGPKLPDRESIQALVRSAPQSPAANPADHQQVLVRTHCGRCHMLPDPAIFSKKLWVNTILPEMGCYLGMHNLIPQYEQFFELGTTPEEKKLFKDRVLYPPQPLMTQADWDQIVLWYMENSPENPPRSTNKTQKPLPEGKFETVFIGPHNPYPQTTLIHIDEKHQRFFASEASSDSLSVYDATGKLLNTRNGAGTFSVAHLDHAKGEHQFIAIGVLNPNDIVAGSLWKTSGSDDLASLEKTDLPLLKRPVSAVWADFDQDGREEIVIAEYGNKTGQLSFFHKDDSDNWQQKILNHASGNKTVRLADMNQDGWQDLVVLRAQESEDLLVYYNIGNLAFIESYALKFPPSWGSNDFELADLNNDGHLDLILANGDNGDSTNILKNFHGIRVYENDKKGGFLLKQRFPLHGAYSVRALDHDRDGDLDLIALSTFPDFSKDQDTIYLLDQVSPMEFEPFAVPNSTNSRWIAMDAGDLDGDGDIDLLFAPFVPGPSSIPQHFIERASALPSPFLLMKNLAIP